MSRKSRERRRSGIPRDEAERDRDRDVFAAYMQAALFHGAAGDFSDGALWAHLESQVEAFNAKYGSTYNPYRETVRIMTRTPAEA